MANKSTYKSFVKDIFSDMKEIESETLREASKHVRKKMKKKVSKKVKSMPGMPPGLNVGNLKKGIKFEIQKSFIGKVAFVGVGPPAQHAHLLEFGTIERHTKKGVSKGKVLARPFVIPTFDEESEAVKRIMMGQFGKL